MTKKDLNQNAKFEQELIDTFEPNFIFSEKPLIDLTVQKTIII